MAMKVKPILTSDAWPNQLPVDLGVALLQARFQLLSVDHHLHNLINLSNETAFICYICCYNQTHRYLAADIIKESAHRASIGF